MEAARLAAGGQDVDGAGAVAVEGAELKEPEAGAARLGVGRGSGGGRG